MSRGYTYFDDEIIHGVAAEYIELIKKKTKGGKVRYDSGDFLALDQHDRKRVVQSLLEYEQGHRILVTLKDRIAKSLMGQADKDELIAMINPPAPKVVGTLSEAVIIQSPVIEAPVVVESVAVESKRSTLDKIFNFLRKRN